MNKKIIILLIFIIFVGVIFFNVKNYSDEKKNQKRYEEIKRDINNELKNYLYIIAPKCQPNSGNLIITHKELVYNAGMNMKKLLDIDNRSYCKVYVKPVCIKVGVWNWNVKISCSKYEDKGYVNWDDGFKTKK